jgi:hypothetical protein
MKTYKVWIQIEEIDKGMEHYLDVGEPYEAGSFGTEATARKFIENELLLIKAVNAELRNACQSALKFLNGLGKANLKTALEGLAACRKKLKNAINYNMPAIDDSCPKCDAGCEQRELVDRDFLDVEAVHAHYLCKKCGSKITEELTLTDVFIDDGS